MNVFSPPKMMHGIRRIQNQYEKDKDLILKPVPGMQIIDRAWVAQTFADRVGDEFLLKVRKSHTSHLKLFDQALKSIQKRIFEGRRCPARVKFMHSHIEQVFC